MLARLRLHKMTSNAPLYLFFNLTETDEVYAEANQIDSLSKTLRIHVPPPQPPSPGELPTSAQIHKELP